jgi:hypothetical protein
MIPTCEPIITEEVVYQYDSRDALTEHEEKVDITSGTSLTSVTTNTSSETSGRRHSFGINSQISLGAVIKFIQAKLKVGVVYGHENEATTSRSWSNTQVFTMTETKKFSRKIRVPPGVMVQLYQPVLYCDELVIRQLDSHVRRVDTPKNGTSKRLPSKSQQNY